MDGLSKRLIREMNITNLRTFLLPKGWTENRRHGFFLSPDGEYPKKRYWIADPDKVTLHHKKTFTDKFPYTGGSTWDEIWSAPWERMAFSPVGEIGIKPLRRRKPIEQNATETESSAPADEANK